MSWRRIGQFIQLASGESLCISSAHCASVSRVFRKEHLGALLFTDPRYWWPSLVLGYECAEDDE
jgi:hypothetical protein